jgi:hypothetical protein
MRAPSGDTVAERPRNVAYARVWTAQREPVLPADLADALYGRGFMPGVTDPEGVAAPVAEAGLADARFEPGGAGFRVISLTSSRGAGCRVAVKTASEADLPDDYRARRAVPRPHLVYELEAGGPSHSDRNLCENIAEALLLMTGGLVEIGGLGTKGNRPVLHSSSWIGAIKATA